LITPNQYDPLTIVKYQLNTLVALFFSTVALGALGTAACAQASGAAERAVVILVREATTGSAVEGARVSINDAMVGRTDSTGRFAVRQRPVGRVDLAVQRLGYAPRQLELRAGIDTIIVRLDLVAASLGTVEVRGGARGTIAMLQPATVLEGEALDRRLSTSIAATIAGEPGVSVRTNGPVATAPVIRGLSGDRIIVLEDGLRTGDIATTAADHAITIDPLSASRIEVIRGPAGLVFGSSTLGGVVNVVRDDVPRERIVTPHVAAGTQLESASRTRAFSADADVGRGPLAVHASASGRLGVDSRTPLGVLPFTDVSQQDIRLGASMVGARGHFGAAVRHFRTNYGVPSSFAGVTLPGAHDGGVYVRAERLTARVEGEWRPASGVIEALAVSGNAVRFEQDEFELGGIVGTRFGQLSASGDAVLRFAHGGALPGAGAVGVWGQWRDLRAEGSFTGTRPAESVAAALYAYDAVQLGRVRLSAGARWDAIELRPLDSTETRLLRDVRTRRFAAPTGSLSAQVEVARGAYIGASMGWALRTPAIEELYSAGPHLANYAYEVGLPSLRAERGRGVDLFARVARGPVFVELAAYENAIDDYIIYAPATDSATGEPLRDPRLRRYIVYRPGQADARLRGVEGRGRWTIHSALAVDGVWSAVRGVSRGSAAHLPAIPPDRARLSLALEPARAWNAGIAADFIAPQRRVPSGPTSTDSCVPRVADGEAVALPAEFCPTDGALLVELRAGVRLSWSGHEQLITVVVENALDRVWRDHLWRAKAVAPQQGRNVRLMYRVTW
jgi:iron complex outermembrane receptor protein